MAKNREVPLEMHPHHIVKLFLGHVEEHPFTQDASHAHGPVYGTPSLHSGIHSVLGHCHLRDIARHARRLAACGLNFGYHGICYLAGGFAAVLLHSVVADDNSGTFGSASQSHSPADAPACASDYHTFAFQVFCGYS